MSSKKPEAERMIMAAALLADIAREVRKSFQVISHYSEDAAELKEYADQIEGASKKIAELMRTPPPIGSETHSFVARFESSPDTYQKLSEIFDDGRTRHVLPNSPQALKEMLIDTYGEQVLRQLIEKAQENEPLTFMRDGQELSIEVSARDVFGNELSTREMLLRLGPAEERHLRPSAHTVARNLSSAGYTHSRTINPDSDEPLAKLLQSLSGARMHDVIETKWGLVLSMSRSSHRYLVHLNFTDSKTFNQLIGGKHLIDMVRPVENGLSVAAAKIDCYVRMNNGELHRDYILDLIFGNHATLPILLRRSGVPELMLAEGFGVSVEEVP